MGKCFTVSKVFRLACFAAFMSTLFIYSPNVMTLFVFDTAEYTGLFAPPCLVATFLASCALFVASLLGFFKSAAGLLSRRAVRWTCVAAYLLSCGGFVVCLTAQLPISSWILMPCAVLAGITVVGMCLMWAEALRNLDLHGAMCFAAAGLLSSALLHTVSSAMWWGVAAAVELALLFLGAIPLACALGVGSDRECQEVAEPSRRVVPGGCRAFLSIMGVPLVGMAISSFAIGVRPSFLFDGSINVDVVGMYLAAALMVPLLAARGKTPLFAYVYQFYLPVVAGVVTLACAVLSTLGLLDWATLLLCAFFTLMTVEAIAAAIAISNADEFPRAMVFATLIAVYSGLALCGITTGAHSREIFDNKQGLMFMLAVAYACGMLVTSSAKTWNAIVGSTQDDALELGKAENVSDGPSSCETSPAPETFEERLERISKQGGLSARETQIASYVGRGHTSVYVAKTLLISDSTVYTHVRNIYRKLGITSREELIQLFNECGE